MTIHHAAYTIDMSEFHSSLATKIVRDDRVDVALLRSLAIKVAENASVDTKKALEHFRFGEEWLSEDDGEPNLWYMVVLSNSLRMAPGLSSHRFRGSWHVLDKSLPILGWNEEIKNQLIFGKPIRTYLEDFRDGIFRQVFRGAFGGFLFLDHVESMKARLAQLNEYFKHPNEVLVQGISEFAQHNSISPEEALNFAYWDAQDMLDAAIRDEKDLFLHLD